MKKFVIILIVVLLLIFGGILLTMRLMPKHLGAKKVKMRKNSVLVLDLGKEYPERKNIDFSFWGNKGKVEYLELLDAINAISDDADVEGVLVKCDGVGLNRAQAEEVEKALLKFKKSGKWLYGYADMLTIGRLSILAYCDSIFTPPESEIILPGLAMTPMFFHGTMNKLGIGWDVVKQGKYKGAMEMFTNDSLSAPLKESYELLLDDIYSLYRDMICEGRKISQGSFDSSLDKGMIWGDELIKSKLVDGLLYPRQLDSLLMDKLGISDEDDLPDHKIGLSDYVEKMDTRHSDQKIALIVAEGTIGTGKKKHTPFGAEKGIFSDNLSKAIRDAAYDDDIKAIVLRVNSPGGSALASDIIHESVVWAKKKKPVVVSMSSVAASGGYYISMGADSILAENGTITGSIGVIAAKPYFTDMYKKIGVTTQALKRGRFADMFTPSRKFSDDERNLLKSSIAYIYHTFVSKAAKGRGKSYAQLDSVAQGRVWTGKSAVRIGIVDRIGGLMDAIAVAQKMAGIPLTEKPKIVYYPSLKGFWEILSEFDVFAPFMQNIPPALREYFLPFNTVFFTVGEPLTIFPYRLMGFYTNERNR